jgi:hypothetical protein
MKFSELEECPICGCAEYYSKEYVYGTIRYIERFDEEEAENGQLYDSLSTKNFSGRCYCSDCDSCLGNKINDTVSKLVEKALKEREDTK